MEDTSRMLTQDEIDALVNRSVTGKPAPAHKTVVSSPSVTKPAAAAAPPVQNVQKVNAVPSMGTPEPSVTGGHSHDECIAAADINSLQERMAEIVNRISRMELIISKLEQSSSNAATQINPATIKAAIQQIQNVSSQVEVISEGLRGTAGYNIQKIFNCSSCGSVGVVAVKVKCTKCGQENWWGWWPKKK